MMALGGILVPLFLAIIIGRQTQRWSGLTYVIMTLIAIAQVSVVLYMMFSMKIPIPSLAP